MNQIRLFRTSFFTLLATLVLSCGFAHAAVEPQYFTASASDHAHVGAGESLQSVAVREMALARWQHEVAQASRFARSDMHASGGGLVFTAIHDEPEAGDSLVV